MYNIKTYNRVIISIIIGVFCLVFFYKRLSLLEFSFGIIIILSYNYKLLSVNKCPKCGRYMKKKYKTSFFLPDAEECEYDKIEYEIKYRGENNI
jgi:hypothetical protein